MTAGGLFAAWRGGGRAAGAVRRGVAAGRAAAGAGAESTGWHVMRAWGGLRVPAAGAGAGGTP